MELKGNRITLRTFNLDDSDNFLKLVNEADIQMRLPGIHAKDIASVHHNIEIYKNANFIDDIYLVIIDNDTKKVIGALICVRLISKSMDMAYCISQNSRGKGFMLEALLLFLNWYKKQDIKNNIFLDISKDNIASIRVADKLKLSGVDIREYTVYETSRSYVIRADSL